MQLPTNVGTTWSPESKRRESVEARSAGVNLILRQVQGTFVKWSHIMSLGMIYKYDINLIYIYWYMFTSQYVHIYLYMYIRKIEQVKMYTTTSYVFFPIFPTSMIRKKLFSPSHSPFHEIHPYPVQLLLLQFKECTICNCCPLILLRSCQDTAMYVTSLLQKPPIVT